MMSLKKLDEWKWCWRAPQFVNQTQCAKQREDDNQCVRENAYLHVEPAEILDGNPYLGPIGITGE
jgi:hypothetical protein